MIYAFAKKKIKKKYVIYQRRRRVDCPLWESLFLTVSRSVCTKLWPFKDPLHLTIPIRVNDFAPLLTTD